MPTGAAAPADADADADEDEDTAIAPNVEAIVAVTRIPNNGVRRVLRFRDMTTV
jgi:hypothetical protein